MADFPIKTFKYGLDTRREQLTSVPGTLVGLLNAYINEGGEVAKRGAFNDIDTFTNVDTLDNDALFSGVFVDETFYTFGSALPSGSSVTQSQPVIVGSISQIYLTAVYQQLKHPTLSNDTSETYDNTKHRMTRLVTAEVYDGKTLAVAEFADGYQFLYYDGELVKQSANGLVLDGRTAVSDLSTDLSVQVNNLGWDSDANLDENGAAQDGSTMVRSPESDYFGAVLSVESTDGVFGLRQFDKSVTPTPPVKATAQFAISANAGTFLVEAPAQATATTPLVSLCGIAIPAEASAALTATAIATAINDFSSDHGYTAAADGVNVVVYAPVGYDIDVALDLTVTASGGGATTGGTSTGAELSGDISTPLVLESNANGFVTFSNSVLTIVRKIPSNPISQKFRGLVTMNVAGGTPGSGYTYQWSESEVGSGNGITFVNSTSANFAPEFTFGPEGGAVSGSFKCVVFDNTAPTPLSVTKYVTFTFAYVTNII
jgi:hypothetical protein